MKRRTRSAVLCLLLLVLLPVVTTDHGGHVDRIAHGFQLDSHGHGPHTPCPPAREAHCLACGAVSLFAPPPGVARPLAPEASGTAREVAASTLPGSSRTSEVGRSPPAC